ncbi:hypothetical protein SUGI_0910730 [Cryptomeria japonica]|nr:hypothetical protein SUGI_0910730 [Cryptomeria japonica]
MRYGRIHGVAFLPRSTISKAVDYGAFLVFMGVALFITAFLVLARMLAELKLLTRDEGHIAMSVAACPVLRSPFTLHKKMT